MPFSIRKILFVFLTVIAVSAHAANKPITQPKPKSLKHAKYLEKEQRRLVHEIEEAKLLRTKAGPELVRELKKIKSVAEALPQLTTTEAQTVIDHYALEFSEHVQNQEKEEARMKLRMALATAVRADHATKRAFDFLIEKKEFTVRSALEVYVVTAAILAPDIAYESTGVLGTLALALSMTLGPSLVINETMLLFEKRKIKKLVNRFFDVVAHQHLTPPLPKNFKKRVVWLEKHVGSEGGLTHCKHLLTHARPGLSPAEKLKKMILRMREDG